MFKSLKKKVMSRLVRQSEIGAMEAEIMIQFYRDILEYEKDELSEQHKNDYLVKIKTLEANKEFNEKAVRYIKPLL